MNEAIGENIKRLRDSAGLTQHELADKMNMHQATVCRIENGQQSVSILQLFRFWKVMGWRFRDIFKGVQE